MAKIELYGSAGCPFTQELREWLEWHKREFDEYDVEADPEALARMSDATGGQLTVPVLIEDGKEVDRIVGAVAESQLRAWLEPQLRGRVGRQRQSANSG